jgi:hypothetical protein
MQLLVTCLIGGGEIFSQLLQCIEVLFSVCLPPKHFLLPPLSLSHRMCNLPLNTAYSGPARLSSDLSFNIRKLIDFYHYTSNFNSKNLESPIFARNIFRGFYTLSAASAQMHPSVQGPTFLNY